MFMWDAGLWGGWVGWGCGTYGIGGVKAKRKKVDNKVSAFLKKNPTYSFLEIKLEKWPWLKKQLKEK